MSLGEIDPSERLVEGGEADVAGRELQIAGELVEDLLGVEVPPDRRTVLEGCVRVLAADDQIAESVVLRIRSSAGRWSA
jgi:hypothetical protein